MPWIATGRPDMTARSQIFGEDLPEQPKVLLVDDDEVNLLLTSVALQEQGFAVTETASGEQAIRDPGRLPARHRRARRRHARPRRLRDLPRVARPARLRVAAGADADRPRRRRLDHPRLRSRRHRLLRQVDAMEPARRAAALSAARLAHAGRARAQQVAPGPRPGPGAHGQLRLAQGPGRPDVLDRRPARVRHRAGRAVSISGSCCAWCPTRSARPSSS